ncbi:LysE family translocator [Paenibacillus puerhi]|uniref:LysE family translocator n=1 Tax=Paenibacillus puerhi TaxID=2692622 RepID=UPI001F1B5361|nr:LysE family transporter [Paenibacillus puerhi]
MLIRGFKFGMLLQLAVGPVCMYIFQVASGDGFVPAEAAVLGVVLVDGLFMLAALWGIASVMERLKSKAGLKRLGAAVLFLFGADLVASLYDLQVLPRLSLGAASGTDEAFIYAILLTASSPLTILFWAGVFSTKLDSEQLKRSEACLFGAGALGATASFMTVVAFMGSITHTFISPHVSQLLNAGIGLVFMGIALSMLMKKEKRVRGAT